MAPKKELPRVPKQEVETHPYAELKKLFMDMGFNPQGTLAERLFGIITNMVEDGVGAAKKKFIEETFPDKPQIAYPNVSGAVLNLTRQLEQMGVNIRPHDQELLNAVNTWYRKDGSYSVEGGLHKYGNQTYMEMPQAAKKVIDEAVKAANEVDFGTVIQPENCIAMCVRLEDPDMFLSDPQDNWESLAREIEAYGEIISCQFMAPRKVILT